MSQTTNAVIAELMDRRLLNDVDDDLHQEIADAVIKAARLSRPDTAAARLREAANAIQQLDPLAIRALESHQRQLDQDGVEVGVSRQAVDEIVLAVKSMRKALSTGDEAKESEGGCICQDQHRRGYCTEPGCPYAVRPSEPSPPADRREIVARIACEHIYGPLTFDRPEEEGTRNLCRGAADAILAALDGGRDA